MFAKKRHQEKALMKKTIAMHEEKEQKHKADDGAPQNAVPAYLLERDQVGGAWGCGSGWGWRSSRGPCTCCWQGRWVLWLGVRLVQQLWALHMTFARVLGAPGLAAVGLSLLPGLHADSSDVNQHMVLMGIGNRVVWMSLFTANCSWMNSSL
jgi:hypothetical protein